MVKDKRVYLKKIDHSNDISYENEVQFDNVNSFTFILIDLHELQFAHT